MEPRTGTYYLLDFDRPFADYNVSALERHSDYTRDMGDPLKQVSITRPESMEGRAFHWAFLTVLVDHIQGYEGDRVLREFETDDPNVRLIKWQPAMVSRDFDTRDVSGRFDDWNKIRRLLEPLAEQIGMPIKLSYTNRGSVVPPTGEQDLMYVRVMSAPVEYERSDSLEEEVREIFGREIGGCRCILPTNVGYAIVSSEGDIVAEVSGNTVYILFAIEGTRNGPEIIKKVLEEYVRIENKPRLKKKLEKEAKDRIANETEHNFARLHSKTTERRLKTVRERLSDLRGRIESYGRELTQAVREQGELFREEKVLETIMSDSSNSAEVIAKLNAMRDIPGVVGVEVTRNTVSVFTDTITIRHTDGKFYEIGEFRIDFNVREGNEGVRCHNLANRNKDNCHYHPHVTTDGDCCFGNISSNVYELLGEFEFYGLTVLLMTFLSSCNLADAYCSEITKWPVVKAPKGQR